jgi:hypothetical protein
MISDQIRSTVYLIDPGPTKAGLVDVGDDDGSSRIRKRAGGGKTHAGAATGHQGNLSSKVVGGIHGLFLSFGLGIVLSMLCAKEAFGDDLRATRSAR